MGYFEREVTYAEVLEGCNPGPTGTSLEQVKDVLEKYGVHTLGFSGATTGKLKHLRYPAIIHSNRKNGTGHFLVLLGWEREKRAFRVYSPPSFYGHFSEKELGSRPSGLGLAVSDQPLPVIEELLLPEDSLWPYLGLLLSIVLFAWVAADCCLSCRRRELGGDAESKLRSTSGSTLSVVCLACLLSLASFGCNGDKGSLAKASNGNREIDLGRQVAGPPIKYTFQVLNGAAKPFRVGHVRKSCSCETATVDRDRVVNPGEYTSLTVEIPTKGREGPQAYQFILETDSSEDGWSTIPLILRAQCVAKIRANPSQISFGTVPVEKGKKARLVVVSAEGNVCNRFRGCEVRQQVETVLLTRRTDAPAGMIEMEVEIPSGAPIGDVNAVVVLEFDDREVPRIEVPVIGRVEGDLRPVPQVLIVSSGDSSRRVVALTSRNETPFSVTAVHSDAGIRVEPESTEQGTAHRYEVFVETGLRPGDHSIIFTTDRPVGATLTLPVIVHE
ncbi:MAG: DUF1573 domain-containing protein [Planctomycetes bacterium]|nr:DUF1573 domain-containing protein [Planctomycetota bacterium]